MRPSLSCSDRATSGAWSKNSLLPCGKQLAGTSRLAIRLHLSWSTMQHITARYFAVPKQPSYGAHFHQFVEATWLMLAYCLVFLFIHLSIGKFEMVKVCDVRHHMRISLSCWQSKLGLGVAAVWMVFCSMSMSVRAMKPYLVRPSFYRSI